VLGPLLVSAAIAAVIAPGALRAFAESGWTRANFRGDSLPFPAGVVAVCAAILAFGTLALAERATDREILDGPAGSPAAWLALWLGVAFLGLVDDLLDAHPRGWRGHARALLGGGFDTGALKALGTAALAFAVTAGGGAPFGEAVLSTLLIALATNFFNLLDLRPGRAAKAWLLLAAALLLAEWDAEPLRLVGVVAGPLLVLGLFDLRERCMLGDTGSNVLGVLAGTWLVVALGPAGEAVAAAVLLALTIFGEFRSISAAVDRLPPLRALDSLGRRSHA
jgi:UDP-N-acetylmuramyl pentapeptide phosphotransferase/UDP-N-acetylglucosamine-1-phosphate transferase